MKTELEKKVIKVNKQDNNEKYNKVRNRIQKQYFQLHI